MLSALVMRKKNVSIGRENNRILSYKNDSVITNFLVVSTNFIKQVVEERNKKTPSVLTLGLYCLLISLNPKMELQMHLSYYYPNFM